MIILICSIWAVFRLTYMLVEEDGPGHIFLKLRRLFITYGIRTIPQANGYTAIVQDKVPKNIIGEILGCFYCCSIWVATPFGVYLALYLQDETWLNVPIYVCALSGAAILIEMVRRKLDTIGQPNG